MYWNKENQKEMQDNTKSIFDLKMVTIFSDFFTFYSYLMEKEVTIQKYGYLDFLLLIHEDKENNILHQLTRLGLIESFETYIKLLRESEDWKG